MALQKEKFLCSEEPFIDHEVQLDSRQKKDTAFVTSQDALRSEKVRRASQFGSRVEQITLLREMIKNSYTSVVKLTSFCDTLHSRSTARTLEVSALRARPSIAAFGSRQPKYDFAVCERDLFASMLCSLADHSSHLESDFADYFIGLRPAALMCSVASGHRLKISGHDLILLMTRMMIALCLLSRRLVIL